MISKALKASRFELLALAGISLVLGAALSAWLGPGSFWTGWAGTSLLLLVCFWGLLAAWRLAGSGRALAWMMALAFVLRLGVGVLMTWDLPRLNETDDYIYQAGFFFRDAYARDREAWTVAQSGLLFSSSIKTDFLADQYGGMLVLGALVYGILSSDAHRIYLILILTAAAGAIAVPFFWAAVRKKWGTGVALPAAWVLALYPEGVLLGSTQMREPFVIALSAVLFWGVVTWPQRKSLALAAFGVGLLGLFLLTPPAALAVAGIFLGWLFIQEVGRRNNPILSRLSWLVLAAGVLVMIVVMGEWLRSSILWDASHVLAGSERLQGLLTRFPDPVKILFLVIYGLTQPVLPAAAVVIVGKDTPMILKLVNLFTSLGWYLLAPLLLYVVYAVWQQKDRIEQQALAWLTGSAFLWLLIASARAGGDQWDNPRYRAILLIVFALLAGVAWNWARVHRDAWLGRWIGVEGVFLFFFTGWYLKRYTPIGFKLPFWEMIGVILLFSALIIGGGWAFDRFGGHFRKTKPALTHPPESL